MTGFEILMSTSALLAVPVIASHWRIQPRPVALAAIWSVALTACIVLTTLSMCAAALIGTFGAAGREFSPRHLIPAVPFTGWISLAIITVAVVSGIRAIHGTSRRRRQLVDRLRYADVTHIDEVAVVTLPTEDFVAVAVPGPDGCVLMSEGAIEELSPPELRAVVHHEDAHRRLGHHRHLLLARAADQSLWFVPGMRHATRTLRESLEIAADADAGETVDNRSVAAALRRCAPRTDRMAARRLRRINTDTAAKFALGGLSLGLMAVSAAAVFFELSWLGVMA